MVEANRTVLASAERRVSDILIDLADGSIETVGDLLSVLEARAFAALIFLLCFPCSLPSPPGVQTVFGWPLFVVSLQFVSGRKTPWLPKRVLGWRVQGKMMAKFARRLHPYVTWLEKYCRPRVGILTSGVMEQAVGGVILLLAVAILIPLPLTNNPAAAAALIIALGLFEKDGVIVLMGVIAATAVLGGLIWVYGTLLSAGMSAVL